MENYNQSFGKTPLPDNDETQILVNTETPLANDSEIEASLAGDHETQLSDNYETTRLDTFDAPLPDNDETQILGVSEAPLEGDGEALLADVSNTPLAGDDETQILGVSETPLADDGEAPLTEMTAKYCTSCGEKLKVGAAFCGHCGARVPTIRIAEGQRIVESAPAAIVQEPEPVSNPTAAVTTDAPSPASAQVAQTQQESQPQSTYVAKREHAAPAQFTQAQPLVGVAADVPRDAAPAQFVQAQPQSMYAGGPATASTQTAQAQAVPVQTAQVQAVPAQTAQVQSAPAQAAATYAPSPAYAPTPTAPAEPAPKKKIKPVALVIGAVALICIIFVGMQAAASISRTQDYEQANEYYDSGNYEEAAVLYRQLGDFEDSSEQLEKANLWMEADAAKDAAGEDPAAWKEAAKAYEAIGPEASIQAEECNDAATYYTARKQMAKKKWVKASKTLSGLSSSYRDVDDLKNECDVHVQYSKAEKLYSKGKYYDAYTAFNLIGYNDYEGTSDALERAQQCIQSDPEAGVVERNDAFSDNSCDLKIVNSSSDNVYYKLYIGDDFVISAFIPGNGTAAFSLPSGTYRMNKAYGDAWFGPKDMFGNEGEYYRCMFGNDSTVELEPGYEYEISSSGSGTGITGSLTDRGSF